MNNIKHLIYDENGRLVVSNQSIEKYDELQSYIDEYTKQQNELKTQIMEEMIENSVTTSKTGRYTISLVQPKDKEIFDEQLFIEQEEVAILQLFTIVDESEELDLDKLKNEFPEVYNKCVKHTQNITVDTDKLKKALPEVYYKYTTIEKGQGKTSIRFVGGKK